MSTSSPLPVPTATATATITAPAAPPSERKLDGEEYQFFDFAKQHIRLVATVTSHGQRA